MFPLLSRRRLRMDRVKVKQRSSSSSSSSYPDEAAIAKAAAWAWYQRGSGNDSRCSAREYDLGRRAGGGVSKPRRPSRYKQEALAASAAAEKDAEPCGGPTVPLLDLYETEWITRELERFISANDGGLGGQRKGRGRGKEEGGAAGTARSTREGGGPWVQQAAGNRSSSEVRRSAAEATRARRKVGGPWVRHAAGVCSAAEDVVEAAVTVAGLRRLRQR